LAPLTTSQTNNAINRMGKPLAGKKRIVIMLSVVIITIAVITLVRSLAISSAVVAAAKKAKLTYEIIQIREATQSFDTEYGFYPIAPDNATVIKILTGATGEENRRRIAFINIKPSDLDAKGELLDPWGTPFDLSVFMNGNIHVRSAGPDKIFNTTDDEQGDTNLSGEK
jgi:hypothetical protein